MCWYSLLISFSSIYVNLKVKVDQPVFCCLSDQKPNIMYRRMVVWRRFWLIMWLRGKWCELRHCRELPTNTSFLYIIAFFHEKFIQCLYEPLFCICKDSFCPCTAMEFIDVFCRYQYLHSWNVLQFCGLAPSLLGLEFQWSKKLVLLEKFSGLQSRSVIAHNFKQICIAFG